MRPLGLVLVVAVIAAGDARAQETTPAAPPSEVAGAAAAGDPASSAVPTVPASAGSRFANWRPIRRWLRRTSASQGPVEAPAVASPAQPAIGTAAAAPPVPAVNPSDVNPGAAPAAPSDTPPTPGFAPATPGSAPATPDNAPATRNADATAGGAVTDASRGSIPISGNPAAVDIVAGTGALGRLLGLDKDSGIRLGGLWIGDTSGVLSGGQNPGTWAFNSLTIVDLNLDANKLMGWKGASFDIEFLQFAGQNTNGLAGAFPGFDSIEAGPPFNRNQLYELWYRQSLFDDKLIFRIGKSVPTYDFNNVSKPVPVGDEAAAIPAVTALFYTPVFVNPTMLGVIPGYYNSATGITTTYAPTKTTYLNYGFYDGNAANPDKDLKNTGLSGPHFNGYYFHIGEIGHSYRLGEERKPGNFGVGVWGQTGKLNDSFGGPRLNGALGMYLFGAQRLWFRNPGVDNSGISGFYQFGVNDNNALSAREYVGGGLTAFGLVPGRPDDTFGVGLNNTWLAGGEFSAAFANNGKPGPPLRPTQLMFQCYYQMKIVNGWFFQTALTDIPTPALPSQQLYHTSFPNALAITLRLTVLF
jgi:porin